MKIELDLSSEDLRNLILGLRLLKAEQREVMQAAGVGLGEAAATLGELSLLEDRLVQHLR